MCKKCDEAYKIYSKAWDTRRAIWKSSDKAICLAEEAWQNAKAKCADRRALAKERGERGDVMCKKCEEAGEAYVKARAPAWETYLKARAPAWETYLKAIAPAEEAYEKVTEKCEDRKKG